MSKFNKGDIIKGIQNNGYGYTNGQMRRAEVLDVISDGRIRIKILEHVDAGNVGSTFVVNEEKFELVVSSSTTLHQSQLLKGVSTKAVTEGTFITIEDKYTIFVPVKENTIGIAVRSDDDLPNQEMGEALAMYRHIKKKAK